MASECHLNVTPFPPSASEIAPPMASECLLVPQIAPDGL